MCIVYVFSYNYKRKIFLSRRLHYSTELSLETIVTGLVHSADVAIDTFYEHLYWTEWISEGGIRRCNYDGSNKTVIMKENYVWSVTLDLENRLVFFSILNLCKTLGCYEPTQNTYMSADLINFYIKSCNMICIC